VALLLLAAPLEAAITVVTSDSAGSSDNNAVTTAGVNSGSSTGMVVAVAWYGPSGTPTVSDSPTNTLVAIAGATICHSGSGTCTGLWYATSITTNGSHTVTASLTSGFPSIAVVFVAGIHLSSALDQVNEAEVTAQTIEPGSVTPGEAGEIVCTGATAGLSESWASIDDGFTLHQNVANSGNHFGLGLACLIQTSAAAANPTWTVAGGVDDLTATVATFKEAAGGTCVGRFSLLGAGGC